MSQECRCALGADECTGDTGIFHPFQVGGMCDTRPCQRNEHRESLEQSTDHLREYLRTINEGRDE